jgi:hypothetical protein
MKNLNRVLKTTALTIVAILSLSACQSTTFTDVRERLSSAGTALFGSNDSEESNENTQSVEIAYLLGTASARPLAFYPEEDQAERLSSKMSADLCSKTGKKSSENVGAIKVDVNVNGNDHANQVAFFSMKQGQVYLCAKTDAELNIKVTSLTFQAHNEDKVTKLL